MVSRSEFEAASANYNYFITSPVMDGYKGDEKGLREEYGDRGARVSMTGGGVWNIVYQANKMGDMIVIYPDGVIQVRRTRKTAAGLHGITQDDLDNDWWAIDGAYKIVKEYMPWMEKK